MMIALNLQPEFPVPYPTSLSDQPFPGTYRGQRPHDGCFLPMILCLDAKHAETAVIIVEVDALYHAEICSVAGRRSGMAALMWGFILPRMDGGTGQISGVRLGSVEPER
jgi:hypothetical protein